MLSDLGTFVLTGAIAASDTHDAGLVVVGGLVTYIASGPLIHYGNGNASGAWLSVLMRVGIPFLAGAAGYALAGAGCTNASGPSDKSLAWDCDWARVGWAAVGGAVGILTASALDAAFLGWKSRDAAPPPAVTSTPPALRWLPSTGIAYDSGHRATATFGLQGAF
jgi:hypothetical protein